MKYEELRKCSEDEINIIMEARNLEEIKLIPLSLGEYHTDPEFVQNFCISLLDKYQNNEVRANAILGLSYLARRFRQLDTRIKPYLDRETRTNTEFLDRVEYSIEDIILFAQWY